jgi:hypothetical protein
LGGRNPMIANASSAASQRRPRNLRPGTLCYHWRFYGDTDLRKPALLWLVSFVLTAAAAYYQRVTGPTHPVSGRAVLDGRRLGYRLPRSHSGNSNALVSVRTDDPAISGVLNWKRHRMQDSWTRVEMKYCDGSLAAELPVQPPAAKLEYRIQISRSGETLLLPESEPAVMRFRGEVPVSVLILHVVAMFGAMLLSTRTGLEYLHETGGIGRLTAWTIGFLVVGGMILGPVVQKYAFGAYWTGWPFGHDLTDNKTALALAGWVGAAIAVRKSRRPPLWAALAALLLLAVYMIPHSVLGSEYDYGRPKEATPQTLVVS